jgi:hypothetical protein
MKWMKEFMANPVDGRTSEAVLSDLRATCQKMRELIKRKSPQALVGFFWTQVLMSLIGRHKPDKDGHGLPSFSHQENSILFAMEYVHASVSVDGVTEEPEEFDEAAAQAIIGLSDQALKLCFEYQMTATTQENAAVSIEDSRLAFQILSNWVMIRGRRFQVQEEEFFAYVLAPHDAEIQSTYGITSANLASQLQKIANAPRVGFDDARFRMIQLMKDSGFDEKLKPEEISAAIEKTKAVSPEVAKEAASIFDDMFNGGLFNLSKHADLPDALLADLAFVPGENTEFDDASEISGTPFKTLPARVKPLVKLTDGYFCTEPNFIRDASYRSLQRALIHRNADYREEWNTRQKRMSEDAFADLMSGHLKGASIFKDVYYPIGKKQWAETDCVVILGDVLINIEAKAGAEALAAPAESLKSHIRTIEKLVRDAYKQTKRFIDYLYSRPEAPLYERRPDGKYREVARVRVREIRKVFAIGLTVEAFTPFSASIKESADVTAIQGQHDFISLSIDDLMVIRRILRGTGEFLHYLDVRQVLASMKNVMLFDEMDHLGAYISQNRIDQRLKEMIAEHKADQIWVDGMDQDVIGPYFSDPDWPDVTPPAQEYPAKTQELLNALEAGMGKHWLDADSFIRNMSGEGRAQFSENFASAFPILRARPITFFAIKGDEVAVFGLMRFDVPELREMIALKADALSLAFGVDRMRLFELSVNSDQSISSARMQWIKKPSILRADYSELLAEAAVLKAKMKPL